MSSALKCPNPTCPFLFDPTQVPPGAVLTCPRCGMRFMLGPAATIPPPAAPHHPPVIVEPGHISEPSTRSIRHRAAESGGSVVFVALGVVAVVVTACAVGFHLLSRAGSGANGRPAGAVLVVADFNFAYEFPGPPWEKDPGPPAAARANLFALRRADGEARMAFAAAKFDTHDPRPGDLREPLHDRLRRLFDEPQLTEEQGATWAGRPAVKYTFRGVATGSETTCAGEAYGIGHKGIAYWVLAWGPEREAADLLGEFADLRGRFRLLDHRTGWAPTALPFVAHPGEAVDYRIVDTERWWKKPPGLEPRDVDPKADLVLWAEYPSKKRQDVKPRAELVAYVLDPVGDDPVAAIRNLIRDRYAKEADLFGPTKLTELTDEPQGDPPAHTEQQGVGTIRLRADCERDANRSKLHVLAAITVGDKAVGVEVRCPWADRALWEWRLVHVAGSLRPGR